jgi:hypothetical protein
MSVHTESTSVKGKHQRRILTGERERGGERETDRASIVRVKDGATETEREFRRGGQLVVMR